MSIAAAIIYLLLVRIITYSLMLTGTAGWALGKKWNVLYSTSIRIGNAMLPVQDSANTLAHTGYLHCPVQNMRTDQVANITFPIHMEVQDISFFAQWGWWRFHLKMAALAFCSQHVLVHLIWCNNPVLILQQYHMIQIKWTKWKIWTFFIYPREIVMTTGLAIKVEDVSL